MNEVISTFVALLVAVIIAFGIVGFSKIYCDETTCIITEETMIRTSPKSGEKINPDNQYFDNNGIFYIY